MYTIHGKFASLCPVVGRAAVLSLHRLFAAIGMLAVTTAGTADISDAEVIPHVDNKARESYRLFLSAPRHRAFAIAPGGAWNWVDGEASRSRAEAAALAGCAEYTRQRCVVYAVNDDLVFDPDGWSRLWGPYLDRSQAGKADSGTRLGQRFPDLVFRAGDGRHGTVSDLRGRVVILHFWGTWCTYCRPELTELQALYDRLAASGDFEFVLLQVRESYATTAAWLGDQGFTLPQYDSGVKGADDEALRLADGGIVPDRMVAPAFPTTYVLDRHGVVVFHRIGPALRWREYLPLLRDVADHSGN